MLSPRKDATQPLLPSATPVASSNEAKLTQQNTSSRMWSIASAFGALTFKAAGQLSKAIQSPWVDTKLVPGALAGVVATHAHALAAKVQTGEWRVEGKKLETVADVAVLAGAFQDLLNGLPGFVTEFAKYSSATFSLALSTKVLTHAINTYNDVENRRTHLGYLTLNLVELASVVTGLTLATTVGPVVATTTLAAGTAASLVRPISNFFRRAAPATATSDSKVVVAPAAPTPAP